MGQGYTASVVHPPPTLSLKGGGYEGVPSRLAKGRLVACQGNFVFDQLNDAFGVFQYLVVPEADDAVAVCFDNLGSRGVGCTVGMLPAVAFDREAQGSAGEVDDEIADLVLAGEADSHSARAQMRPQPLFRFGRIVTQIAREAGESLSCQRRTPIPTLPHGEGLSVAKSS